MSEVRTYQHGVPCWVDTAQPDPEAACRFYGELFGWSFEDVVPAEAPGAYFVATLDGQDVAAVAPAANGATPTWSTYVAVDDADASAAAVTAAGGAVALGPVDAGPGGRQAGCVDPHGAPFRLWQARRRPGAQRVRAPGAWDASDLRTADPEAARTFYAAVFGWEFDGSGPAALIRRPGAGDGRDGAVVGAIGPAEGALDRWGVTFAVADRDDSAARAEALGATVVAGEDSERSRTAAVRDPQGAELTLRQPLPPDRS